MHIFANSSKNGEAPAMMRVGRAALISVEAAAVGGAHPDEAVAPNAFTA